MRESALLADQPLLKSLMVVSLTHTTSSADTRTIADEGQDFWRVSGSDFFALLDRDGKLLVSYNRGAALERSGVQQGLESCLQHPEDSTQLVLDHRLYEVSTQPLVFGDQLSGSRLGFVAVGYAVDESVAHEVSEAAAADVAFAAGGSIVTSTLPIGLQQQLVGRAGDLLSSGTEGRDIDLGGEEYLAASVL